MVASCYHGNYYVKSTPTEHINVEVLGYVMSTSNVLTYDE